MTYLPLISATQCDKGECGAVDKSKVLCSVGGAIDEMILFSSHLLCYD